MYYTHNLRVKLQNEVNRVYKSAYDHLSDNLRFFLDFVASQPLLSGFLNEAVVDKENMQTLVEKTLEHWNRQLRRYKGISFQNRAEAAVYYFNVMNSYVTPGKDLWNLQYTIIGSDNFEEQKQILVDEFIRPITNFLEDQLDEGSSVLYLLEKYKLRTENFLAKELRTKYQHAPNKGYEQVLDDDLRLYLFDQGIDNPFSTPKSASGRADIVSGINTSDPLILEIKVFDSGRQYGKDRIRDGFNQALKYSRDYNKNVAYVAVFVLDDVEIELTAAEDAKNWPHRISYNNCYFHFVFIYLNQDTTASKSKTKKVTVSLEDLIKEH